MARKIAVRNSSEHLKKSVACLLIRRLVARWTIPGVELERIPVSEQPLTLARIGRDPNAAEKPYIPDRMPSGEIPGCRFVRPPYARKLVLGMEEVRA